jgi:hypothetical protein
LEWWDAGDNVIVGYRVEGRWVDIPWGYMLSLGSKKEK